MSDGTIFDEIRNGRIICGDGDAMMEEWIDIEGTTQQWKNEVAD